LNRDAPIPEMHAFAMSLLVVATGDSRRIPTAVNIVQNAALRYCLEFLGNFSDLVRRAGKDDLSFGGWLSGYQKTRDFFVLCGQLLDALDRRVHGRHTTFPSVPGDEASTYDHAAYLALGQTLCRKAGVKRADFPPINECISSVARTTARGLQKSFVTNYLANVLQDYFDASRIRAEFPSLPPDMEEKLRTEDAAAVSDAIFARLGSGDGPVDVPVLQEELQDLIGRVWLVERTLDDQS
jgi:hypothetical protein